MSKAIRVGALRRAGQWMGERGRSRGFTLIELLIVVAVLVVLLSIAVPGYQEQVRKTRRSLATKDLLIIAQGLERFHTVNGTYVGGPCAGTADSAEFYTFSCPTLNATAYTINAAPKNAQANDKCGTFTLTHTGVKGLSSAASGTTAASCW